MNRIQIEREIKRLLGDETPAEATEDGLAWWEERENRWALLEALERYQRRGGDRYRQRLEEVGLAAGNAGACKVSASLHVWTGGELEQLRDILRAGVVL